MDKCPEAVLMGTANGQVRQNRQIFENCIAEKQQKTEILKGGDPEINSGWHLFSVFCALKQNFARMLSLIENFKIICALTRRGQERYTGGTRTSTRRYPPEWATTKCGKLGRDFSPIFVSPVKHHQPHQHQTYSHQHPKCLWVLSHRQGHVHPVSANH